MSPADPSAPTSETLEAPARAGNIAGRFGKLTKRQRDCLRLVGQGYTSKEIGPRLGIRHSTVDNHIHNAVQILEAPGRAEAARMLADHEASPGQRLPRHPPPLADAMPAADDEAQAARHENFDLGTLLPPIGGRINDLPTPYRIFVIAKIALFSTLVFLACVIVIRTCFDALR